MKKLTLTLAVALLSSAAMASEPDVWKDYDGYDDLLMDFHYVDTGVQRGRPVDIDAANKGLDGDFEHLTAAFQRMSTPSDFKLSIEGMVDEDLDGNSDILGGV